MERMGPSVGGGGTLSFLYASMLGRARSSTVSPAGSRMPRTNSSPSSRDSTPARPPCDTPTVRLLPAYLGAPLDAPSRSLSMQPLEANSLLPRSAVICKGDESKEIQGIIRTCVSSHNDLPEMKRCSPGRASFGSSVLGRSLPAHPGRTAESAAHTLRYIIDMRADTALQCKKAPCSTANQDQLLLTSQDGFRRAV